MVPTTKYLSPHMLIIYIIAVIVSWLLLRYCQCESAQLRDFSRNLALAYINLTKQHSVGECAAEWTTQSCAAAWTTLGLQEMSLESKQAELVHRLLDEHRREYFGSKENPYQTYLPSSKVAWRYIILSLQLSTIAIICVVTKQYRPPFNTDWDQLLEEWFPVWSLLPVLRYLWRRWFCQQRNLTFNKRLWRFPQTRVIWFVGLCIVALLFREGLAEGFLYLLEVYFSMRHPVSSLHQYLADHFPCLVKGLLENWCNFDTSHDLQP